MEPGADRPQAGVQEPEEVNSVRRSGAGLGPCCGASSWETDDGLQPRKQTEDDVHISEGRH